MIKHGTDKVSGHSYADAYEFHFKKFRQVHAITAPPGDPNLIYSPVVLLEIGVGGYADPNKGGCSLRAWKEYFPNGQIYSFDNVDKTNLSEDRITIFCGSQGDPVFIEGLKAKIGKPDIIIDDGSHICAHQIDNFKRLFPILSDGGIYVIEDTQTSYWPELRGGSPQNTVDYFRDLVVGLNYREIPGRYEHTYMDENILSIHFYHNLIFIYKGDNTEESNTLKGNKR